MAFPGRSGRGRGVCKAGRSGAQLQPWRWTQDAESHVSKNRESQSTSFQCHRKITDPLTPNCTHTVRINAPKESPDSRQSSWKSTIFSPGCQAKVHASFILCRRRRILIHLNDELQSFKNGRPFRERGLGNYSEEHGSQGFGGRGISSGPPPRDSGRPLYQLTETKVHLVLPTQCTADFANWSIV